MDATLTERAADMIAASAHRGFDDDVLDAVRLCLLDSIGCCVRGGAATWVPGLSGITARSPGPPEAFHFGLGVKTAATQAALANGVLGHSLIREDMHVRSGSHIGVLVLPAMLALAQRDGLSGRSLIAGIVTGYEMAAALGMAIWGSGRHNRHLRPSGMTGAFGVAAGAAAALGVDRAITVNALGIALNCASGLNQWAWSGSQEIFLHAGMAAQSGLQAIDLAMAGIVGSADVLEGQDGAFAAFGCGETAAALFADALDPDRPRAILGVRHKPVAGCNFVQTPVAAARQAKAAGAVQADRIERVVLHSFAEAARYPGCDHAGPFTSVQQSKMSLQYAICATLVHDRLDEAAYAGFDHPELLRLLPRVEIRSDPAFEAAFPARQGARVDLWLTDDSVWSGGYDDVPWLSAEAVVDRLRDELGACGAGASVAPILASLGTLIDSPDAGALWAAIGGLARPRG